MKKKLLIIFCKNPELGKVKTRIAATMGDEKALAIYYKLINYTQQQTEILPFDKVVYYSNHVDREDSWGNEVYEKDLQKGNDLGERMHHAFLESFAQRYSSVCIIGTDCIEITKAVILEAFNVLEKKDAVLGPAKDGGYYLLGMNKLHSNLFQNKNWSTDSVANDTIQDFESLKLSYSLLPILSDVDEEKDVTDWFR
jgi:rSAM/selenodomain-associated transferase 1